MKENKTRIINEFYYKELDTELKCFEAFFFGIGDLKLINRFAKIREIFDKLTSDEIIVENECKVVNFNIAKM